MYFALFVTMCNLGVCNPEELIVDSDLDPKLSWMGCQLGIGLADWKAQSRYASDKWSVGRWKCVVGRGYVPKAST